MIFGRFQSRDHRERSAVPLSKSLWAATLENTLPTDPKGAKNRGLPTLSKGALSPSETRHRWTPRGQSGLSPIVSPSAENLDASVFIPFLARRAIAARGRHDCLPRKAPNCRAN